MIDLNENRDKSEISIRTDEDYKTALMTIEHGTQVILKEDSGKRILKLIEEINLYEKINFQKINTNWLR